MVESRGELWLKRFPFLWSTKSIHYISQIDIELTIKLLHVRYVYLYQVVHYATIVVLLISWHVIIWFFERFLLLETWQPLLVLRLQHMRVVGVVVRFWLPLRQFEKVITIDIDGTYFSLFFVYLIGQRDKLWVLELVFFLCLICKISR